jgi:hypothetical protein
MLAASEKFSRHLTSSHSPLLRIGVWLPDVGGVYSLVGYLGAATGSLTVDYRRNIRRQATLTVASLSAALDYDYATILDTRDYLEALTSSSAELSIEWGLAYPDLTQEWVTIARLRVEESTRAVTAVGLDVTAAYDGGCRVADFPLVTPYAPFSVGGTKLTYVAAIQDLVNTSYPTAAPPTWHVGAGVDATSLPPDNTAFTGDRWTAVNSLAKAINVTVGVDAAGDWVIAVAGTSRAVAWTVADGADGVLVGETTAYSRREQFNAIPIRWENPDGTGGLVYLVDSDPASPTYYDGAFGRKPRPEEALSTVTTSAQATAAATTLLDQYKGLTRGISLTALHNPLIEPGDVIAVHLPDGSAERHVIDSVNLPLVGGTVSLETRILRGGITYEEDGVIYEDTGYSYEGQPA